MVVSSKNIRISRGNTSIFRVSFREEYLREGFFFHFQTKQMDPKTGRSDPIVGSAYWTNFQNFSLDVGDGWRDGPSFQRQKKRKFVEAK